MINRLLIPAVGLSLLMGTCASAQTTPDDAANAPEMVIVDQNDVVSEEAPPHGRIGMSTAYRISDVAPDRTMEFRIRSLHPGAAIGEHIIRHDEVYYVVSGVGRVVSDGEEAELTAGMTAYLYDGANVGITQLGDEPLTLIIAYPLPGHPRLAGD